MVARRLAWRSALLAAVALAFVASLPGSQGHKNATSSWHKDGKWGQLKNDTNITTATLAFQSLGLKSSIPDGSTIFAPSDSAFLVLAKILNATTPSALLSGPSTNYSTAVLKYHVIPSKVIHSYDLKANTSVNVTTLLGKQLTVKKSSDGDVWVYSPYPPTLPTGLKERLAAKRKEREAKKRNSKDGSKDSKDGKDKQDWGKKAFKAKVVKADIPWGNSVVHVIDKVLLPPL